jgi:hypothetical protein
VEQETEDQLFHLGVKIPQWMVNQIHDVQERLQQERPEATVTRTDAVRRVMVKGLEALGMNLKNTETKEGI